MARLWCYAQDSSSSMLHTICFFALMLAGTVAPFASNAREDRAVAEPLGQTPAQTPAPAPANLNADPETMLLWPNGAPGALGSDDADRPTLTVYRALRGSGTAIIVAPGGGYTNLASNHEGRQVANLLNAAGVTTFVLKYRLGPKYHHPIEL